MKKFVLQVMWNNFQLGTRRTQMQILNPKPNPKPKTHSGF